MPKIDSPNEKEREIMIRNGIDPGPENNNNFCVLYRDSDLIALRCHKTHDEVTIRRGERKW
jgi:hypothetical protein